MKKKNLPAVIASLLQRIDTFVHSHCIYGRKGTYRAMRSERISAITILLKSLGKSVCLAQDGAFVLMRDGTAFPLTVRDMCNLSGLKRYTVERALQDLREMGFIKSSVQTKRTGPDGLEVAPVLRWFTEKFWRAVGLWSAYIEAVKYAVQHSRLKVAWLFQSVAKLKAKIRSLAAKQPYDEAERQRQRNNRNFSTFVECLKKRGASCFGGGSSADVCALCRMYR